MISGLMMAEIHQLREPDGGLRLRRIFISWEDIKGFRFGDLIDDLSVREHLNSPYLQSYVILKDGRHLAMSGLMIIRIRRAESRRRVQLLLNELEEERLAHLGGM